MSLATTSDLQRILRSYAGRYTIGSTTNDIMTSTEAGSYLDDAMNELILEYNTTSSIYIALVNPLKSLFVRLECLYVLRMLRATLFSADEDITVNRLYKEIESIKKALSDKKKITNVDVSDTSIYITPFWLEK